MTIKELQSDEIWMQEEHIRNVAAEVYGIGNLQPIEEQLYFITSFPSSSASFVDSQNDEYPFLD